MEITPIFKYVEEVDLEKLGEIVRHLIAVKEHIEDMRLSNEEWLLLEKIGYPERFKAQLQARTDKELVEEVYSHIDSIIDTADRMTSGNFMHNRAAIKFSANTIAKVLESMGLKPQKGTIRTWK